MLLGFLVGVAFSLIVGQLTRLTGIPIESSALLRPIVEFAGKIGEIHFPTLVVGLGLFILLRVLRWYAPRFPGPLVAIALGVAVTFVANLAQHGVAVGSG